VSQKNEKIAVIIERFRGQDLDPHYLAFFDCFNQQLFFEAHEVLEKIWLPQRQQSNGPFYKGLIQFAGAFVHLQKGRLQPAAALLRLARGNLSQYEPVHYQLDVSGLIELIESWLGKLDANASTTNPLSLFGPPKLTLLK
jgi:predicted metal-dependent hydrolase